MNEHDVREHLSEEYAGVFTEEVLENFMEVYVGMGTAPDQVERVLAFSGSDHPRVLDVGSGYGSFVIAALAAGMDAVGVEISEFEVKYARERLLRERPGDDSNSIFVRGSGLTLPFASGEFDVVTAWNVLEHVPDPLQFIQEVARVLRPAGQLHLVCPNYNAFRSEAHYQVFWPSRIPRSIASSYLRLRGKNPKFFEENIYYTGNLSTQRMLRRCGLEPTDVLLAKIRSAETINQAKVRRVLSSLKKLRLSELFEFALWVRQVNPLKKSVSIIARKTVVPVTSADTIRGDPKVIAEPEGMAE